jgi:hypothetical protein
MVAHWEKYFRLTGNSEATTVESLVMSFSGANRPVAGGFVVRAGGGVAVALDEVDYLEDGFYGGVGDDAVA